MKIAIDLLWLRPQRVGGTEFYIRNLLDGFLKIKQKFEFVLLVSKDNKESFQHYSRDGRFSLLVAPIISEQIGMRIIWQNLFQNGLLRKNHIKYCFVPVYCRPLFNGGIEYINTIHDIQAYHYPQYHPLHEVWYTKLCWYADFHHSKHIIATTRHVKLDLIHTYKIAPNKIDVLNIPVVIHKKEIDDFSFVKKKYHLEPGQYYYTVAQMIPHKNLPTLVKVMARIKENKIDLPCRLLISGISGNGVGMVREMIADCHLEEEITLTGFISNEERNALYKNARAFLFPSVFEGFGIPAVEAMFMETAVVTTQCTSIPEVTQKKANYVNDPYCVEEWVEKMLTAQNCSKELNKEIYEPVYLANKYLAFLDSKFGG